MRDKSLLPGSASSLARAMLTHQGLRFQTIIELKFGSMGKRGKALKEDRQSGQGESLSDRNSNGVQTSCPHTPRMTEQALFFFLKEIASCGSLLTCFP